MLVSALAGGAKASEHRLEGEWKAACFRHEDDAGEPFCITEMLLPHATDPERPFVLYFAKNAETAEISLVAIGPEVSFAALRVQVREKDWMETRACRIGQCVFPSGESSKILRLFQLGRIARVQILGTQMKEALLDREITLLGFRAAMNTLE